MQWRPNTTIAAIIEQNNRFLLVEESINGKLVFNQPAGHLEHGETLIEAVKREVMEETAWEFEPESLVGVYLYSNPHQLDITYLRFCFYGNCIEEHLGQALDAEIIPISKKGKGCFTPFIMASVISFCLVVIGNCTGYINCM